MQSMLYQPPLSLPLNATDVQVFPNPATDNVNIGFIATHQDITTLLVSDITGKQVIAIQAVVNAGVNKIEINTGNLAAGNYFIQLKGASINFNIRFTKQ